MILTFPFYFSAVSVMLWTLAQTPMQCDRLVLLRFPNQVSSPPPLLSPLFLPSQRSSVLAESSVLRIQGRVCVGCGPVASSICPPFPYGMVAAKQLNAGAVITLSPCPHVMLTQLSFVTNHSVQDVQFAVCLLFSTACDPSNYCHSSLFTSTYSHSQNGNSGV